MRAARHWGLHDPVCGGYRFVCDEWLKTALVAEEAVAAPLDLRLIVAFGIVGGVTASYSAPFATIFFAAEIVLD